MNCTEKGGVPVRPKAMARRGKIYLPLISTECAALKNIVLKEMLTEI